MILCSETCATENIVDSELGIEDYNLVRCDSNSRHTGGTLIYIHTSVKYAVIVNKNYANNTWCLSIDVKTKCIKGVYTVIYHSPSTSDAVFLDILDQICNQCINLSASCIVVGDFNIDMSKHNTYTDKLQRLIEKNGLRQIVNFCTRITLHTNTIIDLILTNNEKISCQPLPKDKISDHETINIVLKSPYVKKIEKQIITIWKNYDKQSLQYHLNTTQWNTFFNTTLENKLNVLCNVLFEAVSKLITRKELVTKKRNQWFSKELKELQKIKNSQYLKASVTKNQEDYVIYEQTKTKYRKQVTDTRNKYIQSQITRAQENSKCMWKCLKTIVNYKEKQSVNVVMFSDVLYTDELEIATQFNKYFVSSIKDIYDSIPPSPVQPFMSINNNRRQFVFNNISVNYLSEIVKQLKNKYNKDLITTQVIKDSFDIVGYFFVNIINESFETCTVPNLWKLSTITPVPKVKNTVKCSDFRPINVLPIHEKLLECTVHKQIMSFINTHHVLIDTQSGFRQNHSCETALNLVLATWKEDIDRGHTIISVFLDFKRAFETIDRVTLLNKLRCIGFSSSAVQWFESYLTGRRQRTEFHGQTSPEIENPYGVPQGSVLGPLLFILYINDIHTAINHCKLHLFADDTLLTISSKNITDAIAKINIDLQRLSHWLQINKLKLNINKTKYMIFGKSNVHAQTKHIIHINGEYIDRVNNFKYLGIVIDDKLKFHTHVQHIIKQIAKKIGILYRASKQLTTQARVTVYSSMLKPHFQYCSTILFLCTNCDIDKLQIQQNKIMRLILKCSYDTHIHDMLHELKWLSVRQLIYYNVLVFIYKMQHNLLPMYLCNNIKYIYQHHSINTRTRNNIKLPNFTKTSTQNSLYWRGFQMYNTVPSTLKNLNVHKFKIEIKQHVITHYPHAQH